jgi:hypothetical protein
MHHLEPELVNGVPAYPPLQTRLVAAIQVVNKPRSKMEFPARKPIEVCIGQRAARRQDVPLRVVIVLADDGVIRVDQASDVAITVRMGIRIADGR